MLVPRVEPLELRCYSEGVTPIEAQNGANGDSLPVNSYVQLLQRIQDLIATGTQISDSTAGTPSVQIHEWIRRAEHCLLLLEDKLPTVVWDFRRVRQVLEFKVDEDDEEGAGSPSAYRPEGADVLLDFNFENLKKANDILKFAANKLEIEGNPISGDSSEEELGEQLHAARLRAGHSQEVAAEKMEFDHKDISEWERGKRKPQPKNVKKIRDYIALHSKPKKP